MTDDEQLQAEHALGEATRSMSSRIERERQRLLPWWGLLLIFSAIITVTFTIAMAWTGKASKNVVDEDHDRVVRVEGKIDVLVPLVQGIATHLGVTPAPPAPVLPPASPAK